MEYGFTQRLDTFCRAPGIEDLHKIRENKQIQLRKSKRNDFFNKRRFEGLPQNSDDRTLLVQFEQQFLTAHLLQKYPHFSQVQDPRTLLIQMLQIMEGQEQWELDLAFLELFQSFVVKSCNILQIIFNQEGCFRGLINNLQSKNDQIKRISLRILINLSYLDVVPQILDQFSIISSLNDLLNHQDDELIEHAIFLISNLAADNRNLRNKVLAMSNLERVFEFMKRTKNPQYQETVAWLFTNLARYKGTISESAQLVLIDKCFYLFQQESEEVKIQTLRVLTLLTKDNIKAVQQILRLHIVSRVVKLIEHPNLRLQTQALELISNIISAGDDLHTLEVLKYDLISHLVILLSSKNSRLQATTCFILSNILATKSDYVYDILNSACFRFMHNLATMPDQEVKKWCIYGLVNLVIVQDTQAVFKAIDMQIFEALTQFFTEEKNEENIFNLTEGIGRLFDLLRICDFDYGYNYTDFLNIFENLGGKEQLETIAMSNQIKLSSLAMKVLQSNYGDSDIQNNMLENPPSVFDFS